MEMMPKMSSPKILVGMPAFNEAKYLADLIAQAKKYAYEVIVVDDGSADFTAQISEMSGATVVRHGKNMGYGAAMQTIFEEARKRTFDALVILDADSQHDPTEIMKVAYPILAGFDVVVGRRNKEQIPAYRLMGQKVLSKVTEVLSYTHVDSQSGFRAYSPNAVAQIRPKEKGMAVASELVSLYSKLNLSICEVPVSVKYLDDSSTNNPVVHGVSTLTRLFVMISERRPLLFFGLGGLIVAFCGVGLGIKAFVMLQENAGALPIGTALMSFLLMVVGVFSVFTGIMLNVVKKMRA